MGTEGRPKVSPGVAQGRRDATKVAQRDPNGCPWPPKGNPVRPEDAQGTQKGTAKVSDRSASGPPGLYIEIRTAAAVGISICKMKFLSGVEIYTRYQVPGNNTRSPTSAQQRPLRCLEATKEAQRDTNGYPVPPKEPSKDPKMIPWKKVLHGNHFRPNGRRVTTILDPVSARRDTKR